MSGAASLAFPGGRTLAGWRRQLAAHGPECLWAGYLTFHRIEAPVLVQVPQKLPSFELLVLKAAVSQEPEVTAANLYEWLHLEPGLIRTILSFLERQNLLKATTTGTEVTKAGRYAATHGEYPKARPERHTFHFWLGEWGEPPTSRFVYLQHLERITWLPAPPLPFVPGQLEQCVRQTAEWKQQHGFPTAITSVLCHPAGTLSDTLEQVMLATPLRCFAVVARTRSVQGTVLLGFSVNARTWEMHAAAPVFRMPEDPPTWFPPMLTKSAVRDAFVEWGRQRQFFGGETERCDLRLDGDHLFVETASPGLGRLRGSHGESWLLAGDGLIRTAIQLDFV